MQERFLSAPLDPDGWRHALTGLANLTGSHHAQLLGLGGRNAVRFNHLSGLGGDELQSYADEFVAIGAHSGDVNWRVAAAGASPPGIVSESHYAPFRRDPRFEVYEDHVRRWDSPNGCQTVLLNESQHFFGLALLRTRAEGATRRQDRALFAGTMPMVLAGIRMQHALEHQGTSLLSNTLEAMSAAAFVCDADGIVRARTAQADMALTASRYIGCRDGRLFAIGNEKRKAFQAAMQLVLHGTANDALVQRLWLASPDVVGEGMLCEIFRLPRAAFDFGFAPRLVVILRPPTDLEGPRRAILAHALGLTATESDIAIRMGEGRSRDQIAQERGIGVQTVITHLRGIFRKCDVSREGQLVALVNRILR